MVVPSISQASATRRGKRGVRDLAVLSFPVVLLAAAHFGLPRAIQAVLALDHTALAVHTVLTSAYVHTTDSHLYGNVASYALVAGVVYCLCLSLDRRRWFDSTFVAFLVVLPVLVNATTYVAFRSISVAPTNSRGFSGVVAGFAGFLLVAIAWYVRRRYGHQAGVNVGLVIFFVLAAEVLVVYSGSPSPLAAGLFVVGFGLSVGQLGYRGLRAEWNGAALRRLSRDAGVVLVLGGLLVGFIWILFPAELASEDGTTNIVAHAAGFGWGLAIAAVSSRLTRGSLPS